MYVFQRMDMICSGGLTYINWDWYSVGSVFTCYKGTCQLHVLLPSIHSFIGVGLTPQIPLGNSLKHPPDGKRKEKLRDFI